MQRTCQVLWLNSEGRVSNSPAPIEKSLYFSIARGEQLLSHKPRSSKGWFIHCRRPQAAPSWTYFNFLCISTNSATEFPAISLACCVYMNINAIARTHYIKHHAACALQFACLCCGLCCGQAGNVIGHWRENVKRVCDGRTAIWSRIRY